MDLSRFDHIDPIWSRYVPSDEDLSTRLEEYEDISWYDRIKRIVPEVVLPRLGVLSRDLQVFGGRDNKTRRVPERVDNRHTSRKLTIKDIFDGYSLRLKEWTTDIRRASLDAGNLTQVIINDRAAKLFYFSLGALTAEANIADDIRQQFRSEIEEYIKKTYGVGSSTMPHKINPIECDTPCLERQGF